MQKNLEKLVRRWLVLVILVLLGGGAGALHAVLTAPTYQASTVVIATTTQPSGDDRAVGFAQAYGRLAGQQDIAASAAGAAKMPVSQARDALQTTTSPDSPMIEIVGSADTPDKSADLVNAAANAIVDVAGTRVNDTGVRLIVLSPAVPPDQPTAPVLGVNIAVGAACGFLLGGLFVLGRGERRPSARSGAAGTGPVPPGGTPGWPADGVARAGSPGRGPAAVPRPPAPAPPWNGRGRPRQPEPRARPAAPPGAVV
ncbi:MAG: hypothetical protein L0I76_37185, partial [Pseudonocardia sp.]|nr:hypothetical protein [Pseudonocardia sp.]